MCSVSFKQRKTRVRMAGEDVWKELNGSVCMILTFSGWWKQSRIFEIDMESRWRSRDVWEMRSRKRHCSLEYETEHNSSIKNTHAHHKLTLCLWGEGQGEFGKELIVFKFILFWLDPETAVRKILRSDLREREKCQYAWTGKERNRDILHPLESCIIKWTQFSKNGHLCTWQTNKVKRTKETAGL